MNAPKNHADQVNAQKTCEGKCSEKTAKVNARKHAKVNAQKQGC
jgi:hypothetical protein